jgi:hypothetical protein
MCVDLLQGFEKGRMGIGIAFSHARDALWTTLICCRSQGKLILLNRLVDQKYVTAARR